jgi:hypothetical protein
MSGQLLPAAAYPTNSSTSIASRYVHTSTNKNRSPINIVSVSAITCASSHVQPVLTCLQWTPEGRRLLTGATSGEFTLWNGLTFNFETILSVRARLRPSVPSAELPEHRRTITPFALPTGRPRASGSSPASTTARLSTSKPT